MYFNFEKNAVKFLIKELLAIYCVYKICNVDLQVTVKHSVRK